MSRITVPPVSVIDDPAVHAAAEEFERLRGALTESQVALGRLQQEHAAAIEADSLAFAAAIRSGKADPGAKRADKLAEQVKAEQRTVEALERAVSGARGDLVDTVDDRRDEWATVLADRVTNARERFAAAIDAVEAARLHLGESANLVRWLRAFPNPAKWTPTAHFSAVPSPLGETANPIPVDDVLKSLRRLAAPPAPPAPPVEHVPPGRQSGRLPRHGVAQADPVGPLHASSRPVVTLTTDGRNREVFEG